MSKIIIAAGPVIVENNQVLLNQHGENDFWKFCGGRTQDDESLMETASRRAKEEMGIEIEIINQTPYLMHITKEIDQEKIDVILVHFLAKRIGNIQPGAEIRQWSWIDITNLDKEALGPNILPTLEYFHLTA